MAAPEIEPDGDPAYAGPAPVLDRDAILNVVDARVQRLEMPEWGGAVYIRVVGSDEYEDFENSLQIADGRASNMAAFRARFSALVLCDAAGKRLFSAEDVPRLNRKARVALDRVVEAGMKLNALSEQDVSDLVGNSDGDLSGSSGSDSQ
jgi:hypothetical protein